MERRGPQGFAQRAWEDSLLFRTRYFIDFTSIEEDPKDKGPGPRAWGPLFIGPSNTVNVDFF